MIIRGKTKGIELQHNLQHIYDTVQKLIIHQHCYYSQEEIEKLKKDKNNNFIKTK